MHFLHIANSDKPIKIFSLDVIISVGYRIKSVQGTRFRQWANKVLKEVLLRGHLINPRLTAIERRLDDHERKIDFFVRASLPPVEGVFFDGQIFDAYVFATNLIKSARSEIVLIDNYIDESVLLMLSKRSSVASAEIRAQRRYDELIAKGEKVSFDEILENVKQRDFLDQTRKESPLRKAEDAIELDNGNLTLEEQRDWLLKRFKEVVE